MWNQRNASNTSNSRVSRTGSHASYGSRGSQPREVEFQFFIRQTETLYPAWWTREGVIAWYRDLPDDTMWNCYICGIVLMAVVWEIAMLDSIYVDIMDVVYNISYAIHVFAIGYKLVTELESSDITFWTVLSFLVDLGSFAHYAKDKKDNNYFKLICYYARLSRPFKYLWSLNDYNLKGSILGTTLKYVYIFMVLRVSWAFVWLHVDVINDMVYPPRHMDGVARLTEDRHFLERLDDHQSRAGRFLSSFYIINKMFIPIGPSVFPDCDMERIVCLMIMITGCLVVTGSAVASLSLVISLYMRPEETFRARYRLIMKEMKDTQVPPSLREKVETFYKMYWHKQRAVSETQLLPTFPPTLDATIDADIYFEATQKARILRELSHQLLAELSKKMETIHYIPGDAIIKRGAKKSKIIFITYGDIEMLTAEDDTTAILRMTRGTVITPCGGAVAAALGLSHLAVRAATFCTAHVLSAADLWRIVYKHSVAQDHAGPILAAFTDHIERVKRHYTLKAPDDTIHKSSILHFNRNLLRLKEMRDEDGNSLLGSSDVFLEIAGCYIMRNRPDTGLSDQSDEICLRPTFPCILQPDSSLLFAWHTCVATLILLIVIMHPYYLVYKKTVPLEFRFFDYFMTVIFVIDHVVYLSTGANVEEGVPISFKQTSSQQMRSHWFVLDVVATLPIFEFIGDGHFAGLNKILRLPKLFRVLKNMEEACVYRSNVLRFLSYTLLLLVACYLIAAMQQGFMCYQSGHCLVTNFTHPPFWDQKPLDEETVHARLWFGLYWAISMINFTVHRQTWGKENWKTVLYTLVILEICIVLRIFMEAVYSATIMVTTSLREEYGARIAMVQSFLIRNEVDPLLRKRFIDYLQLCWHTDKAYKISHKRHSTIFYDLPPHVFQDIVGRNRSKYILSIPFMRLLKKEDLRLVSSKSILFYTSPNEILLNTGELTNEIYIIKQGICEIICPKTHKSVGQLANKSHFGSLICLLRLPAYYTIRAVTHVQVFSIPRRYMLNALDNPQIKDAVDYLKTRPECIRLQKPIPSFIKYVPPDPTPNMMRFKLPRKHEPDAAFLHPFNRLGFLSILRYVFPRFTIRPDGTYMMHYEWFRVICALVSAQLFPHYTYLVLQWPWLYYVTLFLDLSAWYDIFQRMLVGYFNENGILIYHPSSTAAYYMKGAFVIDLFGCLNLEDLESPSKDSIGRWFRLSPTGQFLMLNRLVQLYRMPSAMMMLQKCIARRDILMVIKAIPLFMAMLNVLTCFMIFNSVNIFYYRPDNGTMQWRINPYSDFGGSWLNLFHDKFRFNMTETPWNLHLGIYFWVVYECTTTGYGIFNPSNDDLMQVLFLGMASSAMIITYFSVRIISIRANVNKSLAGFQQNMKDINTYMVKEKLDTELQKEVRRYYEYNWEKMGGIDYRGVLKLCDQITLRTDAILHIYGDTFTKCPLLSEADVSLLRLVGRAIHSIYFLRDMMIIENDDMVTDLYFVDHGGVEIRVSIGEMSSVLRLPRGSVFGNLECTACNRSPYNVVATSRVHLLRISGLAMATIMADFPNLKELMAKLRGPEKTMYILGSEVQAKLRRNIDSRLPTRSNKSIVKYIYFQEGVIQVYLMVICMGVIYLDVYNAGYQDNHTWLIITLYVLDFCFILKIITQHSIPLLVRNKNMKKIMLSIRKVYFQGEFRYDLVSILPIELISFAMGSDKWMWLAWLRLNRMFRVSTVYKCLRRRNEKITVNLTVTTIMGVMIWFTLFVHTTTCLWYFIGTMEDATSPNSSWIFTDENTSHCDNHYICSMYFIITTFTQNGVGDIMPRKQSEVVFVSLLMILSTMVFMVYVGEFSNIIQFQQYRSFSFYSKYLELQDYLNNNRVSKNLMTLVNKYTLHLWRETRGLQMPYFLKNAPLSLRLRVMSAAYLHHITRHHIFEECEPGFLRQLVGCIQLFTYNAGMYVVKESEITDSMYVIHTGKVRETCEDMDSSARVYPAGSYFGIGLIRNTPYTHSYQTMCKSQVLTLHLDDWEYLLKHFPESRNAIHKHMSQVGDKDMDKRNWPGGAPGPPTAGFEPLSQIPDADINDDGYMSQFPGTIRHFGRPSTDEGSFLPGSLLRRQTRYHSSTTDIKEGYQYAATDSGLEGAAQVEELETAVEVSHKQGILRTIASSIKKLMGRVSDSDLTQSSGTEGKDELLLEEDEEATEALLAQFEAAKKITEADKQRKRTRHPRKSIFRPLEDDEDAEKLLLSLDINETKPDKQQQTDMGSLMMRPLQIRTDEDDVTASPNAVDAQPILNISHPNQRKKIKVPSRIAITPSGTLRPYARSETEINEQGVASVTYGESKSTQATQETSGKQRSIDVSATEKPPMITTTDVIAPEETTGVIAPEEITYIPIIPEKNTDVTAPDKPADAINPEEILNDIAPVGTADIIALERATDAIFPEESFDVSVPEETTDNIAPKETIDVTVPEETTDAIAAEEIPLSFEETTDVATAERATDATTAEATTDVTDSEIILDVTVLEGTIDAIAADEINAAIAAQNTVSAKIEVTTPFEEDEEEKPREARRTSRYAEFHSEINIVDPVISQSSLPETSVKPGADHEKDTKTESHEPEKMKEEGTSTTASKRNRRFVHIRYESEKKEEDDKRDDNAENEDEEKMSVGKPVMRHITLDSDVPVIAKELVAENEEDGEEEDEDTTSTSTSDKRGRRKKKFKYQPGSD